MNSLSKVFSELLKPRRKKIKIYLTPFPLLDLTYKGHFCLLLLCVLSFPLLTLGAAVPSSSSGDRKRWSRWHCAARVLPCGDCKEQKTLRTKRGTEQLCMHSLRSVCLCVFLHLLSVCSGDASVWKVSDRGTCLQARCLLVVQGWICPKTLTPGRLLEEERVLNVKVLEA